MEKKGKGGQAISTYQAQVSRKRKNVETKRPHHACGGRPGEVPKKNGVGEETKKKKPGRNAPPKNLKEKDRKKCKGGILWFKKAGGERKGRVQVNYRGDLD